MRLKFDGQPLAAMAAVAAQFRGLDIGQAPLWPWWPRALLCGAACLLGALAAGFLCLPDAWAEREAEQRRETRLRVEHARKQVQAGELDRLALVHRQLGQAVESLEALLPTSAETEALLSALHGAAQRHGLSIELFRPGEASGEGFAGEQTIAVRVAGTYHGLGAFLADVASLPRLVVLRDLAIAPGRDGRLVLDATTRTYRPRAATGAVGAAVSPAGEGWP